MTDLVAWLRERLDEDEMAALAPASGPWWIAFGQIDGGRYPQQVHGRGDDGATALVAETYDGPVDATGLRRSPASAEHIARWDPARVLAECAAKRAILALILGDLYNLEVSYDNEHHGVPLTTPPVKSPLCRALLLALAQPYIAAGRPGFDPAWVTEEAPRG